jgi:hypothetical protein
MSSELSDIQYSDNDQEQDFHEGLMNVYDAVYPGLTSPKGELIPTHLIPYEILKGGCGLHQHRVSSSWTMG